MTAEERIKLQSKVPFNSRGNPLFADSINFWKNSSEVSPDSLLTNGWIKTEEVLQILADSRGNASAVAQLFVWELNDKTMFPAKYYKDVLYYLLDVLDGKKTLDDKDVPETIHYSKVVNESQKVVIFQKEKWRELLKLVQTRPDFYELSKDGKRTSREIDAMWIKLSAECFRKIEEKLKELQP